jgi:formylglycine-generating enzyme required for sulfatase activity
MNKISTYVFVALVAFMALPGTAAAAESERLTSVLIFPIRLTGPRLTEAQAVELRNYLGTRLTMEGVYMVMPESQIKKDLGTAKVESYKDCYDESCRIDLTKTVMADKSLSVEVVAENRRCRVTANLYNIAQEVTEKAADVESGCTYEEIKKSMVAVAAQLSGKQVAAAVGGQTSAGQQSGQGQSGQSQPGSAFTVSALPAVPKVTNVGEFKPDGGKVGSIDTVDVAAYEAYDEALRKDENQGILPADKIKAWEVLASKYPAFADQAKSRAAQWRTYILEKTAADVAEKARQQSMESDWGKLSRLLKLKVFTDDQKKGWAKAFVDAYGRDSTSNPHYVDLVDYLATEGKAGTKWIRIPGGTFQMGSSGGNEQPLHQVTIATFEMAKTEVTVWQYQQCVEAGPCSKPNTDSGCNWGVSGRELHPINCVDWDQASAYAKWVGGRLPTEAEWEYAARAGTTGDRYGDIDAIAWYDKNSGGQTHLVSQKQANGFGLTDTLGNVWEWCQDWYHDSYKAAPSNGSAWENPSGSNRVFRGGSWGNDASFVRAAYRFNIAPGGRSGSLGLRPVRSVR